MSTHATKTGALNIVQAASAVNNNLFSDVSALVNRLGEWVDDRPVEVHDLNMTGRLTIARSQLLGVFDTLGFRDVGCPSMDDLSQKIGQINGGAE